MARVSPSGGGDDKDRKNDKRKNAIPVVEAEKPVGATASKKGVPWTEKRRKAQENMQESKRMLQIANQLPFTKSCQTDPSLFEHYLANLVMEVHLDIRNDVLATAREELKQIMWATGVPPAPGGVPRHAPGTPTGGGFNYGGGGYTPISSRETAILRSIPYTPRDTLPSASSSSWDSGSWGGTSSSGSGYHRILVWDFMG